MIYKLKIRKRQRTIFGDYVEADNWDLFVKAMENDLHKIEPFVFKHPKNKEKQFYRRYVLCPANGNTLLVVGQFRNPMDFVYVIIVLNSKKYKEPYMVIEGHASSLRNPDMVAEMVIGAFNWVLRDMGVEVEAEPWDTRGKMITYIKDGWESYNIELFKIQGRNLVRKGYEDALEVYKKMEARKAHRQLIKKTGIKDYFKMNDHKLIMDILRENTKDKYTPKKIALPFRLLCDRAMTDHIPYKIVIKEMPKLEGLISETRYNHWTNKWVSNYDDDPDYNQLNKEIDKFLLGLS